MPPSLINDPDIEMRLADADLKPAQRTGRCPHCGYCHLTEPRFNQGHRQGWECTPCDRRTWHCMFAYQHHLKTAHGYYFQTGCDLCAVAWNHCQIIEPKEEMLHRCPRRNQ